MILSEVLLVWVLRARRLLCDGGDDGDDEDDDDGGDDDDDVCVCDKIIMWL